MNNIKLQKRRLTIQEPGQRGKLMTVANTLAFSALRVHRFFDPHVVLSDRYTRLEKIWLINKIGRITQKIARLVDSHEKVAEYCSTPINDRAGQKVGFHSLHENTYYTKFGSTRELSRVSPNELTALTNNELCQLMSSLKTILRQANIIANQINPDDPGSIV